MFIRGVTLPNAWKGIKYFINPDWEKMLEAKVWFAAVNQCFFSLSTSLGALIMFGSYNSFHHNSYRDAWIVSGLDTFTSLFAGFTVFAVLGNLAGELDVEVDEVARAGAGLTFVSFAQGLATFNVVPQLFSVLFYLMLLTLGVGSAVSLTQSVIAMVCDQFPTLTRWKVTTVVCLCGFAIGTIYVTPGGFFMQDLVDHFGVNFTIYLMAIMEGATISWVYGVNNWIKDMEFMVNTKLGWYWKICWAGCVPVGLGAILIYALATEKRWTMNGLPYPDVAIGLGWTLAVVGVCLIPVFGLLAVRKSEGSTFMEKLKNSLKPNHKWGPKKASFRREWLEFKAKQA
jgi:solute carrier family 6 amino acid transporter-like protein 5/7/9/14